MKKRFTEAQIIGALEEAEAGAKVASVPQARGLGGHARQLEGEVRRHDRLGRPAAEGIGGGAFSVTAESRSVSPI